MDNPTYFELFAGVGGLGLAVELAVPDVRCIGRAEWEAYAQAVLMERMGEETLEPCPLFVGDIRDLDGRQFRGEVDVVVGGFPCQPFSVAGKRRGAEDERWLWDEFVRIIDEIKPSMVFLENVPGLFTAPGKRASCICSWSDRWRGVHWDNGTEEEKLQPVCGRGDGREQVADDIESSVLGVRRLVVGAEESRPTACEDSCVENHGPVGGVSVRCGASVSPNQTSAGASSDFCNESQRPDECEWTRPDVDTGEGRSVPRCEERASQSKRSWAGTCSTRRNCDACGEPLGEEEGRSLRGAMGDVLWSLASLGFSAEWCRLRASDVGATHHRERWFLLAHNYDPGQSDKQAIHVAECEERAKSRRGPKWSARTGTGRRDPRGDPSTGDDRNRPVAIDREADSKNVGLSRHLFPPSPVADWTGVPEEWSPAIESPLRRMANGPARGVGASRADQIRCLGNAVVPSCAALAFAVLAERLGLVVDDDGRVEIRTGKGGGE